MYLTVHGDALEIQVGLSQHRPRRRLIHSSRFNAYETILNNVNSANTVSTWGKINSSKVQN